MRVVLGWIKDPYIHMLLVGLVLAQLAMGSTADEKIEAAQEPISCRICYRSISKTSGHMHYVAQTDDVSQFR